MKPWILVLILMEVFAFPLLLVWVLKTNNPIAVTLLVIVSLLGSLGIGALCICNLWNPVMRQWPPCEPEVDAVHRTFQSFSMGMLNLGWSVHVAADKTHLHLRPARLIRWMGAVSASIPWNAMQPMTGRRGTAVKLGLHTLVGPRWCMQLVAPEGD